MTKIQKMYKKTEESKTPDWKGLSSEKRKIWENEITGIVKYTTLMCDWYT